MNIKPKVALLTFGLRAFNVLTLFVIEVLLARLLGITQFGQYSLYVSYLKLATIPSEFGNAKLIVRETARGVVENRQGAVKGVWIWSNLLVLAAVLVVFSIAGLVFKDEFSSLGFLESFAALFFLTLFVSIGNLRNAALRGLGHVILGQTPEFVFRSVIFLLLLAGVALTGAIITANDALMLFLVAVFSAFLIGVGLLIWKTPAAIRSAQPEYESRVWMAAIVPLGIAGLAQTLNQNVGVIALSYLADKESISLYKVALQLSLLVAFGLQAINQVVANKFAQLYYSKSFDDLQSVARQASRWSFSVSLLVAAVFFIGGRDLIGVSFGNEYTDAAVPLMVLTVGQVINASVGSVGFLLNMTGHERLVSKVMVVTAIVGVIANFALGAQFGLIGIAVATAVTMAAWNLVLWWKARQLLNVDTLPFAFGQRG